MMQPALIARQVAVTIAGRACKQGRGAAGRGRCLVMQAFSFQNGRECNSALCFAWEATK